MYIIIRIQEQRFYIFFVHLFCTICRVALDIPNTITLATKPENLLLDHVVKVQAFTAI